jgi:hypothetical protein
MPKDSDDKIMAFHRFVTELRKKQQLLVITNRQHESNSFALQQYANKHNRRERGKRA